MSDNNFNILSGLFAQGEAQRKAQDAQYDADKKNKALQENNAELEYAHNQATSLNGEMEGEIATLIRHKHYLLQEFAKERDYRNKVVRSHNTLLDENEVLKKEVEKYKQLLGKPMEEIASQNGAFKQTYENQMELVATWMVSQKAFKELAIQFGLEKGLTADEVIAQGNVKKMDVLESKHNPEHGSNATDISTIENRIEVLKKKLLNKS